MPRILEEQTYDGATRRIERLGLEPLIQELRNILQGFELRVLEMSNQNGGAAVRRMLDERCRQASGWTIGGAGAIDWKKCATINGASLCIGVEIQVSARSDLLVNDLIHLRQAIDAGEIDVGVVVVPTDRLSYFLTDRAPRMSDAKRHVEAARVEDLPLILIAIEHDGPGPPLPKQAKKFVE